MDILSNLEAGHVCWDDNDLLNGKPTGAVRISFGYMSTFEDAKKFLIFLKASFMTKSSSCKSLDQFAAKTSIFSDDGRWKMEGAIYLKSITVYPVKSCAGFNVYRWPLSESGLKYDREWLLRGPNGEILSQKKVPRLCHIRTFIELNTEKLYLESQFCKNRLQISLLKELPDSLMEEMEVYGQRYAVHIYDKEVNDWFSRAISLSCTFVRCSSSKSRSCHNKSGSRSCRDAPNLVKFANEAPLLLISEESVKHLNSRLNIQKSFTDSAQPLFVDATRFRPNLVLSGAEAYAEDSWMTVHIGKALFSSLGGCNRCQMINIDQQNGEAQKSKEPLATLASYRRVQGKILFGILLRYEYENSDDVEDESDGDHWLEVGQKVYPSTK